MLSLCARVVHSCLITQHFFTVSTDCVTKLIVLQKLYIFSTLMLPWNSRQASYASRSICLWKSGRMIYRLSGRARTMCLAYIKQGWNMQLFIESSPITAFLQMLAILISSNLCTLHMGTPVSNWMGGGVLSCFAFRIEILDFNSKKSRVLAKAFFMSKEKNAWG